MLASSQSEEPSVGNFSGLNHDISECLKLNYTMTVLLLRFDSVIAAIEVQQRI